VLNTESPDYALPLATLRTLEAQGAIGGIYPWFYSTVGNQTAVGPARRIGQLAAAEFRDAGVAVALQVSGWGAAIVAAQRSRRSWSVSASPRR